ncbi:MAG: ATP-dependent 6-phosphofructokinase [Nanoarchaeota archaeon]|nr:ATP-dependent 6-phosphofructokinase [Nanoarchaeota archaeon]
MKKRLAILTGGGDVPGLNAAIKIITELAIKDGYEVFGFRKGWAGPLRILRDREADNSKNIVSLTMESVRKVSRTGGTFLHSSRTNPSNVKEKYLPEHLRGKFESYPVDLTEEIVKNLKFLEIDTLVTIGGDDTLSFAGRLDKEGFKVVAIPKTMDNDVWGTDYCIGFSTAVTRGVNLVTAFRTPVGSHERIGIIEVMGRYAGFTAWYIGYLAEADRFIIPEINFNPKRLAKMLKKDREMNPSRYSLVVVSEGAVPEGGDMHLSGEEDAYGHKKLGGIGMATAELIKKETGVDVMFQNMGYLLRSGEPDAFDRMVAKTFGIMAFQQIKKGNSGVMTVIKNGKYAVVPISDISGKSRKLDVKRLYDPDEYRADVKEVMGIPMFGY